MLPFISSISHCIKWFLYGSSENYYSRGSMNFLTLKVKFFRECVSIFNLLKYCQIHKGKNPLLWNEKVFNKMHFLASLLLIMMLLYLLSICGISYIVLWLTVLLYSFGPHNNMKLSVDAPFLREETEAERLKHNLNQTDSK